MILKLTSLKSIALILSIASLFILNSCMEDYGQPEPSEIIIPPSRGVFIANEGNFTYGNASLSYYNIDSMTVENEIFYRVNGFPLGDVCQSVAIRGDSAYIVVNNSSVIYVINKNTFKLIGKITGLVSPRYIHFVNDEKAYVTDLYAFAITIFNPKTLKKTGRINVRVPGINQHPTEQMVQYKNFVFTNCWSYDTKLLVIDTDTDQLVDSIEVGNQPTSLVMDKYNKLWTVTDGGYAGSPTGQTPPALYRIDAETRKVEKEFKFNFGESGSEVNLNGARDTLYFINKHVWRLDVKTETFPAEPFLPYQKTIYYGVSVDPVTSEVYVADAINYTQRGVIYRYSPQAKLIDKFRVGIIPGDFCFIN